MYEVGFFLPVHKDHPYTGIRENKRFGAERNHRFFMQIIDFSEENIVFYRIMHFWRNSLIFHEQRPFFIPFWINVQSSVHREEENVDFVLKLQFWNGKSMIFVETIRTPGFVKTWFFLWKITNFSINFRWKWTILQHFLLHLYTGNNKNDDFESKNINFEQKYDDFFKFFHDHLYMEMCENIDFSLRKRWFLGHCAFTVGPGCH